MTVTLFLSKVNLHRCLVYRFFSALCILCLYTYMHPLHKWLLCTSHQCCVYQLVSSVPKRPKKNNQGLREMEVCLSHTRGNYVLLWRLSKALDQLLSGSCGEIVLSSVNFEYQQKRHCVKLASSIFSFRTQWFLKRRMRTPWTAMAARTTRASSSH